MKTLLAIVGIIALIIVGIYGFSSDDTKQTLLAHTENMTKSGEKTPSIVAKQQRKELIRQDSTWTIENQKKHPEEYCLAQLDELKKINEQLEVEIHRRGVQRSELKRKNTDANAQSAALEKFVNDAKAAYRKGEAESKWPIMVNGIPLSKEKARQKIVEAANKKALNQKLIATTATGLAKIEKKIAYLREKQSKLVMYRDRLNSTLADLKAKRITESENGIEDALNSLNDSLEAFEISQDDVALDDLITPTAAAVTDEAFDKIMSEP